MITLKEVCEKLGVTRRNVQGYEKAGLVAPSGKNKYGYLLYDEEAVQRIKQIKQYRDFGFSVKEIQRLFEASRENYVEMMQKRRDALKKQIRILSEKIIEMEAMIAEKKQ